MVRRRLLTTALGKRWLGGTWKLFRCRIAAGLVVVPRTTTHPARRLHRAFLSEIPHIVKQKGKGRMMPPEHAPSHDMGPKWMGAAVSHVVAPKECGVLCGGQTTVPTWASRARCFLVSSRRPACEMAAAGRSLCRSNRCRRHSRLRHRSTRRDSWLAWSKKYWDLLR
jgi:hypothetical protein